MLTEPSLELADHRLGIAQENVEGGVQFGIDRRRIALAKVAHSTLGNFLEPNRR